MQAVGSPEAAVRRRNGDHRIEETSDFLDHSGQPLVVGLGKIALERRGLNAVDGKHGYKQRMPAERVAISRYH